MIGGYVDEARSFRDWLFRATAGDPANLQIMYDIYGARRLTEYELDWLPGYEGSRPVHVGNAASGQFQLDVYGEVLSCLYAGRKLGLPAREEGVARVAGCPGFPGAGLATPRRRHLGGARGPASLHPFQDHGLGGDRPCPPDHRGVRHGRG